MTSSSPCPPPVSPTPPHRNQVLFAFLFSRFLYPSTFQTASSVVKTHHVGLPNWQAVEIVGARRQVLDWREPPQIPPWRGMTAPSSRSPGR